MPDACVILGGGGHARVLIDCLRAEGRVAICGVLDPDPSRWGTPLLDVPILGSDDLLDEIAGTRATCFVVGVGGIGENVRRSRLFDLAQSHGLLPLIVQHPAAVCSRWARVGAGSQLLPGSIVNAGATVGLNVIVNSGAIVEHDCVIGDHVHVATHATLASTIRVGARAHIGAGATVRQGLVIGEDAIVGAGAVVIADVPPRTVVVGVPAARLRDVSPAMAGE